MRGSATVGGQWEGTHLETFKDAAAVLEARRSGIDRERSVGLYFGCGPSRGGVVRDDGHVIRERLGVVASSRESICILLQGTHLAELECFEVGEGFWRVGELDRQFGHLSYGGQWDMPSLSSRACNARPAALVHCWQRVPHVCARASLRVLWLSGSSGPS